VCSGDLVDVGLAGWVWNEGARDLGVLRAREVLFETWQVAHALIVGLVLRMGFKSLTLGHLLGEIDMLKEDEIGDDRLGACQEAFALIETLSNFGKPIETAFNDLAQVRLPKGQLGVASNDL